MLDLTHNPPPELLTDTDRVKAVLRVRYPSASEDAIEQTATSWEAVRIADELAATRLPAHTAPTFRCGWPLW